MDFDGKIRRASASDPAREQVPVPGKATLTQALASSSSAMPESSVDERPPPSPIPVSSRPRPTLQMLFGNRRAQDPEAVHAAAARGTATAAAQLPHLGAIQRSFGRHDVSGVQAHVGAEATASTREVGAAAYATGNHVVLGGDADLHTEAHEAAHVVQQRAGVQLKGGVGEAGDPYERHADAVADAVVRGESAEALLDGYAGSSGSASAAQVPVQRYSRHGDLRVSDHGNLVVVDRQPHNEAYATPAEIQAGAQRLSHSDSHVTLAQGARAPDDVLPSASQTGQQLHRVEPQLAIPSTDTQSKADQQNSASVVTAELYEALAKNVLASLPADPVVASDEVLVSDMEHGTAKDRVAQVYGRVAGNLNPAVIAHEAQRAGLEPRYVRLIMQKIIDYQQQIKAEIRGGGFTAPKDCGQMARKFVRGDDIRYHALTPEERAEKGYSGHYFASVLEDGTDKVSLENAVGGSKYEQLWKASSFDALWHFEMRGATVDASDVGDEEVHTTGVSRQQHRPEADAAQRDLDVLRQQQVETQGPVADSVTTSPGGTSKDDYQELAGLVPHSPADYDRERDLLLSGLAYANEHADKKGRTARVDGWSAAMQAVVNRKGQNAALAELVLARVNAIRKHR